MLLYRAEHDGTNSENGNPIELESSFLPIGISMFDTPTQYYSTEVSWYPGDLLVIYSDGITEAFNPNSEMYGFDRFKALISQKLSLSAEEIKAEILSDLHAHQQDASTNDDITLVVAKFL